MAYNKFQTREEETVFLDLINDNITETNVLSGVTFHKADGTAGIGILSKDGNFFKATDDDVMNALLEADNVGKIAQFNGTSDTYVDGGYYLIEKEIKEITFDITVDGYWEDSEMGFDLYVNDEMNPVDSTNLSDIGDNLQNVSIMKELSGDFTFYIYPNTSTDINTAKYTLDNTDPATSGTAVDFRSSYETNTVSLSADNVSVIKIYLNVTFD